MKAFLTYFLIFSFGFMALAQESNPKTDIDLNIDEVTVNTQVQLKKRFPKKRQVSRIYLFKNSRVKKELSFRTKRNKTKLA